MSNFLILLKPLNIHGIYETEFDKLIQEKFKKVKEEIGKYKNKENETKKTS